MAVAAFVISALALLVTAANTWFNVTRARNDDRRTYADLMPRLGHGVEEGHPWHEIAIWIELESAEPLDRVDLVLGDSSVLVFGTDHAGSGGSLASSGPMHRGDRASWNVSIVGGAGGSRVRLTAVCRRNKNVWRVPIDLDLPVDVMKTIY